MSEWNLHISEENNRITRYKCGLMAGQRVRLKKELVIRDHHGKPTGNIHPVGEQWTVLAGVSTDPVLQFKQADGSRHFGDDNAASVNEWFEIESTQQPDA